MCGFRIVTSQAKTVYITGVGMPALDMILSYVIYRRVKETPFLRLIEYIFMEFVTGFMKINS